MAASSKTVAEDANYQTDYVPGWGGGLLFRDFPALSQKQQ